MCRFIVFPDHQGVEDYKLRKLQRDGYLAAISREDLDFNSLDKYRICSRHFKSGRPAPLYNTTHPDWLPTMPVNTDRYDRVQRRHAMQELWDQISAVVETQIEDFLVDEVEAIITKQVDKAKQYFKPSTTSAEVEALRKELTSALQIVEQLKAEVALKGQPVFCAED